MLLIAVIPAEDRPDPRLGYRKTPLDTGMRAEGTTTRTTSADGSRPLTERDSDSLEPGGGCVDRSGTTSLRPSDTQVTVNFSPFVLSLVPSLVFLFLFHRAVAFRLHFSFFLDKQTIPFTLINGIWFFRKPSVCLVTFLHAFYLSLVSRFKGVIRSNGSFIGEVWDRHLFGDYGAIDDPRRNWIYFAPVFLFEDFVSPFLLIVR